MSGPIVSFHGAMNGDVNILLASQRGLTADDALAVSRAEAVLLPQSCRGDLFELVAGSGKPYFPRLKLSLTLDGKVGNHRLFDSLGLPQPRTLVFPNLEAAAHAWQRGDEAVSRLGAPLVAKGAGGGEGKNVFLVAGPEELLAARSLETACPRGPDGLVLQELVKTPGRDARVIFVGQREFSFWKIPAPGEFRSNQKRGGILDWRSWPDDLARARGLARRFRDAAGLDLAAVDVLVPKSGPCLLLEVNFYFGREAIGGTQAFLVMYLRAVRDWLASLGISPMRVNLD